MFKKEGVDFLPRYENFLRLTGSDSAESVVRQSIGRNLESPEFWAEAIQALEEPLKQLESLLPCYQGYRHSLRIELPHTFQKGRTDQI